MSAQAWAEFEEATEPQPSQWRGVVDEATADWALGVVARHRRELDSALAMVEAKRQHLADYVARMQAHYESETAYLLGELEGWHRRLLDNDERRKTIRLPAGTLTARKSPDTVQVTDPAGFELWCQVNRPDLLRVRVEPDKTALRKLANADGRVVDGGEVVPGCVWVEGDVTFRVEAS